MKRVIAVLLTFAVLLAAGCEWDEERAAEQPIVLGGMMEVGGLAAVQLTQLRPVSGTRTYGPAVSGAQVELQYEDGYTLRLYEDASGYQGLYRAYPEAARRRIPAGAYLRITVATAEHLLTAETHGAGFVHIDSINQRVVEYGGEPLFLRWQRDSLCAGYAVFVEWIGQAELGDGPVSGEMRNRGTSYTWLANQADSTLRLPWFTLGFEGRHTLKLYSCDKALWDYLLSYSPGMVENYPVSNVVGGIGIFSAAGVDTVGFVLVDNVRE